MSTPGPATTTALAAPPRALCQAIHELLLDRAAALAFRDGDRSMVGAWPLSDAERGALEAADLPGLWRLGVHPILLFHLSAVLHGRAHYIREVVPAIAGVPNPYYDYYRSRGSVDAGGTC